MDECKHGMQPDWCATCLGVDDAAGSGHGSGLHGGRTKQDAVDDICDYLGIDRITNSKGSTEPAEIFEVAARRLGLRWEGKPETCEAVIKLAGHGWSPDFDSRHTPSGGGDTVTLTGLDAFYRAIRALLPAT